MDSHMALLTHAVPRLSLSPSFLVFHLLASLQIVSSFFCNFFLPLITFLGTFSYFFANVFSFYPSSTKTCTWPTTQSCDLCFHGSRAWDVLSLFSTVSSKWQKTVTLHVWKTDIERIRSCFYVLKVMLLCSSPVKNSQLVTLYYFAGLTTHLFLYLLPFHLFFAAWIVKYVFLFFWIQWGITFLSKTFI